MWESAAPLHFSSKWRFSCIVVKIWYMFSGCVITTYYTRMLLFHGLRKQAVCLDKLYEVTFWDSPELIGLVWCFLLDTKLHISWVNSLLYSCNKSTQAKNSLTSWPLILSMMSYWLENFKSSIYDIKQYMYLFWGNSHHFQVNEPFVFDLCSPCLLHFLKIFFSNLVAEHDLIIW